MASCPAFPHPVKDNGAARRLRFYFPENFSGGRNRSARALSLEMEFTQTGNINMEVVTLKYPSLSLPLGPQRENALKHIGGNIRRERTALLMSQEKLAGLVGLNVRTVSKIEAGQLNIRPETLEKIREALGCPLAKLSGEYQHQPKHELRVAAAQIHFLQRLCSFL